MVCAGPKVLGCEGWARKGVNVVDVGEAFVSGVACGTSTTTIGITYGSTLFVRWSISAWCTKSRSILNQWEIFHYTRNFSVVAKDVLVQQELIQGLQGDKMERDEISTWRMDDYGVEGYK